MSICRLNQDLTAIESFEKFPGIDGIRPEKNWMLPYNKSPYFDWIYGTNATLKNNVLTTHLSDNDDIAGLRGSSNLHLLKDGTYLAVVHRMWTRVIMNHNLRFYVHYFANYDRITRERLEEERKKSIRRTALENYLTATAQAQCNGFQRMQKCRQGLEAIDRRGWQRSFHQRMFHDNFIRACARIFWKREPQGAFARDHQKILEANGWDCLSGEVLVSTPRRFGKTISVSMFAAAMLYSCPNLEMSIYSTCKRISQKLLRNIVKFLDLIYLELGIQPYKILRMNSEVCCSRFPCFLCFLCFLA